MKRATVEDILKEESEAGKIKYVTVGKDGTTNYDELVYQKNKKPEERKPVLVMFYGAKLSGSDIYKRGAVIVKTLMKVYEGKILFVVHDATKDDYRITRKENITDLPSAALYSMWNRIKGETQSKNDGVIKQVDIANGMPKKDSGLNSRLRNSVNYWIGPLIFGIDNPEKDGKLYKYNNSGNLLEVAVR